MSKPYEVFGLKQGREITLIDKRAYQALLAESMKLRECAGALPSVMAGRATENTPLDQLCQALAAFDKFLKTLEG